MYQVPKLVRGSGKGKMMPPRDPGKDYADYGSGSGGTEDMPPPSGGLNALLGMGVGCLMCCACVWGMLLIGWIIFVIVTLSGTRTHALTYARARTHTLLSAGSYLSSLVRGAPPLHANTHSMRRGATGMERERSGAWIS